MATPSTALLDTAEKTLDRAVVLKDPTTAALHTLRAIGYALIAIGRELHAGARSCWWRTPRPKPAAWRRASCTLHSRSPSHQTAGGINPYAAKESPLR